MAFLPVNEQDMQDRGWDELDFLFVSGDAYVDHPSFGVALLGRLLESAGYRVGIIAQPAQDDPHSLQKMGRPRFGVLVSSGVVDSMVDNYTAARKRRSDDRYSAGGAGGRRPDRALIRYCNMVREQFGDIALVIGGVEASLRRFAHYDYWSGQVRRSILQDSRADILVYGMGEKPLLAVADLLAKGVEPRRINRIRGTCVLARPDQLPGDCAGFIASQGDFLLQPASRSKAALLKNPCPQDSQFIMLPSYDETAADRLAYAVAFRLQYEEQDPASGKTLIQRHSNRYLVQNPPQQPLTTRELDRIYALPFTRAWHPQYAAQGGVPSLSEVQFSINSHRGCYGGCNFCAITFHQGRIVSRRSDASILAEARQLIAHPDFKGYIHDVGGPTANFFEPACQRQEQGGVCKHRRCLYPEPCPALKVDHSSYLHILRQLRQLDGVKKVFIRSGIRFDYCLMDEHSSFLDELCEHHVSGQLKVAPEHISPAVLQAMGKPGPEVYARFRERYAAINARLGRKQYLVPYLISGHPGCTLDQAIELALYIKANRVLPEQVQDFYPTPGTVSTTMYHTGLDPLTLEPVYVPDEKEKILQRALLQFSRPENRQLVREALARAGRLDLVSHGPRGLITPDFRRARDKTAGKPASGSGGTRSDGRQPADQSAAPAAVAGTASRSGPKPAGRQPADQAARGRPGLPAGQPEKTVRGSSGSQGRRRRGPAT